MALSFNLILPRALPQFPDMQSHSFASITLSKTQAKTQIISCTNSFSDDELASGLASEVGKISTQLMQREEAMKKSRELLFQGLSQYLDLRPEDLKMKWTKMGKEEKWVLVKGFVANWGVDFHPLSAKSVQEMVEQHLGEETPFTDSSPSSSFSSSSLLPDFKKMVGFWSDKLEEKETCSTISLGLVIC